MGLLSEAGGVSGWEADEGVTDLDLDEVSGVPGLSLSCLTWLLLLFKVVKSLVLLAGIAVGP